MTVFVPVPYEDELLYSQCIRYLSEFPLVGRTKILRDMFGVTVDLLPFMARNLHAFAEHTGRATSMTKEDVFWGHSMYPFLCAYLPEKALADAIEYAYYGAGLGRLPWLAGAVLPPKVLRWCPDCVAEDRDCADCGEAYWRRAHQIPGVWQCEKHGCDLVDSEISRVASWNSQIPAEIVIPANVQSFRKVRRCSSMEGMLRARLVSLLSRREFEQRPEHPNFREAAARAGFGPVTKIDYPRLYEAFSQYWEGILDRVEARSKVMGMPWLRAHVNSKETICNPVTREMLDIFFRDRFGLDANEMPSFERPTRGQPTAFHCPNPYADHGVRTPVKRILRYEYAPGVVGLSCTCGFTAKVSEELVGKVIGMADIIRVTTYGPSWKKHCLKLRAEGKSDSEIAVEIGINRRQVNLLCRERKSMYLPVSPEERDIYRAEWTAILERIAPGPPSLATKGNGALYARMLNQDREWFHEMMNAYRQRYSHFRDQELWPVRDEQYTEALIAAAARLQKLRKTDQLTVRELLHEAGISRKRLSKPSRVPRTLATLARLTEMAQQSASLHSTMEGEG